MTVRRFVSPPLLLGKSSFLPEALAGQLLARRPRTGLLQRSFPVAVDRILADAMDFGALRNHLFEVVPVDALERHEVSFLHLLHVFVLQSQPA